ncbi:MAG TPA: type IV pilus assembly protein PilM [Actinomycetota bacterium]|nr:type IV pilus assembly protein PilM [Actinomycetota bacterium]
MAKVRVGLDIGSTAVRAAEMSIGSDLPTVLRAAQVALPAGAVELGEVRQPEVVTEALKELWSRGGFKSREVLMGVGNQRIVVREVTLPFLPAKELKESLGFQVQEFIPMPVDEAVLDYDPIAEFEQDGRQMVRILLVAAQRSMVDMIVQAATAARLEPVGLDLIPFALVRAVGTGDAGMDLESTGDEAVIDVGAHVTSICVHARQIVRFVRILPSGGRDITLAIARGLGIEDETAEELKRGEEVQGLVVAEARRVALSRASSFVDEIRSSLEFYTAQAQAARIGRVLITGGGSKLDGLLEVLRERIPVSVERGQVFLRVKSQLDLLPEALAEAEPVLAAAVGLGIPGRSP